MFYIQIVFIAFITIKLVFPHNHALSIAGTVYLYAIIMHEIVYRMHVIGNWTATVYCTVIVHFTL